MVFFRGGKDLHDEGKATLLDAQLAAEDAALKLLRDAVAAREPR